jgi:hypothetical protein
MGNTCEKATDHYSAAAHLTNPDGSELNVDDCACEYVIPACCPVSVCSLECTTSIYRVYLKYLRQAQTVQVIMVAALCM